MGSDTTCEDWPTPRFKLTRFTATSPAATQNDAMQNELKRISNCDHPTLPLELTMSNPSSSGTVDRFSVARGHCGLSLTIPALALLTLLGCGGEQRSSNPGPIDPDAPTEFTTTESGLKYRILRKSDGAKPTAQDYVTVDYVGWLDDGTEFDNSYDRRESANFGLGSVVEGWTEGLQYVSEGGMIELEIPSELGYKDHGKGSIPGGATLHFTIELHEIKSLPRPGN